MSAPRRGFRWFVASGAVVAGVVLAVLELRSAPPSAFERWFWLGAAGIVSGFGAVEVLALLREWREGFDRGAEFDRREQRNERERRDELNERDRPDEREQSEELNPPDERERSEAFDLPDERDQRNQREQRERRDDAS